MPIVLISESVLRRSTVKDERILRDRQLCGFCVRMNARKRSFMVATSVAGNVPGHARGFISLGCPLIACVSKDNLLLPMQQCVPLSHIVDVGGCADEAVYQTRISVNADVAFHSKVPLVEGVKVTSCQWPPNYWRAGFSTSIYGDQGGAV
jgi:hypothetical protein